MKMTLLHVISIFMFSQTTLAGELPTYFGKTLNTQILEASFTKQGSDLIEYIKSLGLDVISVESTEASGLSQEDRNYWQRYLKKYSALGRYYSPNSTSSQVETPTIILRNTDDKWTVLHEFMHFLFEKRRLELRLMKESELYEAQQNARADYLDLATMLRTSVGVDINLVSRAAKAFADFVQFELQLARQALLEEVAIEQTLSQLYRQNRIPGLTLSQYRTAQAYIENSANRFTQQLDSFYSIHAEIKDQWIGPENDDLQTSLRNLQIVQTELKQALIAQ